MLAPCYEDLLNYPLLLSAFEKVKSNNGIAGVDNVTIDLYGQNINQNIEVLLQRLKSKQVTFSPFHNILMAKQGKKARKLSIPTVEDRIIHTATALLLQPYLEPEFEKCSYGYRPNRSYKMAIDKIVGYRDTGFYWVFDADIESFFDNIPQQQLMKTLENYLNCQALLSLIKNCLFSQQFVDNQLSFGRALGVGIPQGSSLSPLLANLYLDILDEALLSHNFKLIRYADDFIVLTKNQLQAQHAKQETERVLTQLKLNLNERKTSIVSFEQGFTFLGHSFLSETVIDDKSQLLFQSTGLPQIASEEDELLHLIQNSPETAIEPECNSNITALIFDDEEWQKTEQNNNKQLNVILNSKLKTLYVTTQGAVINKKGNRAQVSFKGQQINTIPLSTLDSIILFGRCHLTTDIQTYCLTHKLTIIFASKNGAFHGILDSYTTHNEGLLRQQIKHTETLASQLQLTKSILDTKLTNSLVVIKRIMRKKQLTSALKDELAHFKDNIRRFKNKIKKENKAASLLGFEGLVAKQYFGLYQKMFSPEWQFTSRNRRPPKDPINVMLSLGYTILFNNIYCLLKLRKLNASLGYLHQGNDEQPSLALDIMEEFRAPIVDATVHKLVNRKVILVTDFTSDEQGCHMNKSAYQKFIQAIEDKFQSQLVDPQSQNICDYRRIIDKQIIALKSSILNESKPYKGFTIR